jgi:putative ABC transport system ATP-binding protein
VKIIFSNIKKYFVQGTNTIHVLENIDFEIQDGEVIALLGKSGSGKTTILSLLSGLEKPNSGTIKINDVDLTSMSEDALCDWRAKNLGIVFQQFHLVPHLTALENVSLSMEISGKENQGIAKDWLKKVGLKERENHYPSTLSGGEQQRVAIARALAFTPSLLIADEPTGNLDVETGNEIVNLLFEIVKRNKTTMIFVTHDEELAQKADRIIRISGGKCL